MPAPLLTATEQNTLISACYEAVGFAAAVRSLGLNPESAQRTRREDAAFAERVHDAADFWAERLADDLTEMAFDSDIPQKDRIGLGKQLLRQRPPRSWAHAKESAKESARSAATQPTTTDPVDEVKTSPADEASPGAPSAAPKAWPPKPPAAWLPPLPPITTLLPGLSDGPFPDDPPKATARRPQPSSKRLHADASP